jgi:23S rRNA (pseudouridine1915-N3)-methyltransferase
VINIYVIQKSQRDEFSAVVEDYRKKISQFSNISLISIFNNNISKAQSQGKNMAQKSYTDSLLPYLKGYNIALHPKGKRVNSSEFANIFESHVNINFFIGGAYGFEDTFLKECDTTLTLSSLTMSHKIAKIVLYEQIYRAYTILNNHPYHK